ncbi:substrate-binding domain-containing protein [Nocardia caishijiensis]|uniref:substrate-binding domain-containing protein n=1 Tax=Nocardia caishijiensis TaxID=184756 RepID=UPI000834E7FB|nr:substrate-binding domain-containing protein [Nocardia caishijiensis]
MNFPIEIVLSLLGVVVAVAAFLRQFVFVGRKRIGFRVQMDTPVTGQIQFPEVSSPDDADVTGALRNLQTSAPASDRSWDLRKLSLALVRIENIGSLPIVKDDYTLDHPRTGLRLTFPGREVIAIAVTELEGVHADNLGPDSGIARRNEGEGADLRGIVDLPKVPLDRADHYKILAVLNNKYNLDKFGKTTLSGLRGGNAEPTRSSSRPWALIGLSVFLLIVVLVQLGIALTRTDPPPSYCADGNLTLVGSTAMEKMVREVAKNYETHCAGADFTFDFAGTSDGLRVLDKPEPAPNTVAIGEGPKRDTFPDLFETPFAVAPFAVVTHPDLGITDLSTAQIQRLFRGEIDNWKTLGGPDLPVVVVDRQHGSGSRFALEARLLGWQRPLYHPEFCAGRARLVHCEVGSTAEMAEVVAATPGAVGYLEATTVGAGPRAVTIDGRPATKTHVADRSYPFYSVEFVFHDHPGGNMPAGSLAAKFVDYLVYGDGRLVVAEFGGIACLELARRPECEP